MEGCVASLPAPPRSLRPVVCTVAPLAGKGLWRPACVQGAGSPDAKTGSVIPRQSLLFQEADTRPMRCQVDSMHPRSTCQYFVLPRAMNSGLAMRRKVAADL